MVDALPDAKSPHLHLAHPTDKEFQTIYSASFHEWGDALTLTQFLEESAFLTTIPLAKDGSMLIWILTDMNMSPDARPILSSCETFRKPTFVKAPEREVEVMTIYGIASVFCQPKYRGRGFAARMLVELTKVLPRLGTVTGGPVGSVLYSDIGKAYYEKLGWHAHPNNNHLEFAPVEASKSLEAKALLEEDLVGLCKEDESLSLKAIATNALPDKTRMMIVPNLDHMLWHHRKADFASQILFGRRPLVKGALAGESGTRIWCIWTHRFYGDPNAASSDNTLYILRLVIEKVDVDEDQRKAYVLQLQAILQAAQMEAADWNLCSVKLWDPSPLVSDLIKRTDIQYKRVERSENSIASLQWFQEENGRGPMIEWIANEKYAWL